MSVCGTEAVLCTTSDAVQLAVDDDQQLHVSYLSSPINASRSVWTRVMLSNLFRILNAGPQALAIHLPPVIYSAGSAVDGELEINFRKLQEDNIDQVQVRLRGSARVCVHVLRVRPFESR